MIFFPHKLHKFINMHVADVPVTHDIRCIVVIDSYGLWINSYRLQIIIYFLPIRCGKIGNCCCNGYWQCFSPKLSSHTNINWPFPNYLWPLFQSES